MCWLITDTRIFFFGRVDGQMGQLCLFLFDCLERGIPVGMAFACRSMTRFCLGGSAALGLVSTVPVECDEQSASK